MKAKLKSSVAACLEPRIDYVKNPEKTEKGDLVTSYLAIHENIASLYDAERKENAERKKRKEQER